MSAGKPDGDSVASDLCGRQATSERNERNDHARAEGEGNKSIGRHHAPNSLSSASKQLNNAPKKHPQVGPDYQAVIPDLLGVSEEQ